jgi:hypothetical protein
VVLSLKFFPAASTRMMGILLLVAACAIQGVVAGFLRGTANAVALTAPSASSLSVALYEPITEPLIIPPVDSVTEASLRATRRRREVATLLEKAPLLITEHVAMPLPDLRMCPLRNTTLLPLPLPSSPPRSSLRSSLLRYRQHSTVWPLETHPIRPYIGPAELPCSLNQGAMPYSRAQVPVSTAERETMNKTDIEGTAICGVRVPWLGV